MIVAVDGTVLVENSFLTAVERKNVAYSTYMMMTLEIVIVAALTQQ